MRSHEYDSNDTRNNVTAVTFSFLAGRSIYEHVIRIKRGGRWFIFSRSWSKISKPNRRTTCKEHPNLARLKCHTICFAFWYPLRTRYLHLISSYLADWSYDVCWASSLLMVRGIILLCFLCSSRGSWIHLLAMPQKDIWLQKHSEATSNKWVSEFAWGRNRRSKRRVLLWL